MHRMLIIFYLVIFLHISLASIRIKPFYNTIEAESLFRKFTKLYGKKYMNKLEESIRLRNFINTLEDINYLNSVNSEAIFDINEYADLSKEEFALTRTGYKEQNYDRLYTQDPEESSCEMFHDSDVTDKSAPRTFDWRDEGKVTPVRNQGKCGSCWAFSLIGNIESQYAILTNKLIQFSIQQLVDCVFSSEGCYGGDTVKTARTLISYAGVELESDYPYKAQNQNCSFDATKVKARVVGCKNYDLKDEDKLKEVLYKTGPLSIVLDASTLHSYSGGVMDFCPQHEQNHAVILVGYGTENGRDFWVIKNSWGVKWGENGYLRVKRGINACGLVNDKVVTAILKI